MSAEPHPACLPVDVLLRGCDAERFRASGPGGQRRNKVETGVRLTHRDTGVCVQATERRSQAENHRVAVFRLRVNLAIAVRGAAGDVGPSELWKGRVRRSRQGPATAGRLEVNPSHDDFPALLAEALDGLAEHDDDPGAAAAVLGVSVSQLVKLLRHEPRALAAVNARREAAGRPKLR
ncbi:MAG: peptide chain release factor-like protein [Planctomycetota bacterium]